MYSRWYLCAAAMASVATALTIQPTNLTTTASDVDVALPYGNTIQVTSTLQPLTNGADNLPTYGISDNLFHATAQNQQNLSEQSIAYISCDSHDYPGFTSLNDVFQTALGVNVTAIILYSLTATECNITDLNSAYQYVYSMPNQTASQTLLDEINNNPTFAVTVLHSSSSRINHDGGISGSSNGSRTYGSAPSTAVAMIILYSVTGVITALFLIIIITGAVRAHRHPERYGPRNVMGRPRQSRARGLARAMLDTIPIVKFGEQPTTQEPKSTDVEMAETQDSTTRSVDHDGNQGTETRDHAAPRRSMASARSGIGAATIEAAPNNAPVHTQSSEALGCSICTDDFEMGQDLRVLPCDHKFHPACIDPWLLNVSSTCPLCRIDLRPEGSNSQAEGQTEGDNGDLPPPMTGYNGRPYHISMTRSLMIGLGLDRGHSQEQRVAAARELSEQQGAQQQAEQGEEGQQRRRLRERFGIRTRRRGQSDAQVPVAGSTVVEETPVTIEERRSTDAPHDERTS